MPRGRKSNGAGWSESGELRIDDVILNQILSSADNARCGRRDDGAVDSRYGPYSGAIAILGRSIVSCRPTTGAIHIREPDSKYCFAIGCQVAQPYQLERMSLWGCARSRTRMMVCRVVLSSRASRETDTPCARRARAAVCRAGDSAGLRPSAFPSAFTRASPLCVRSINKSRSNSATAHNTCIVILPADLVRSAPPSARQCTRTPS